YWPLREIVVQAESERPLSALLEPTDEGRAAATVVRATVGLGGQARSEAAPWAFRHVFATLARSNPLVLVLEDAHWAETPLLDLLEEIAGESTPAPVLVLCVGRPDLLSSRPGWRSHASLRVGPLDGAASRGLLAARAPVSDAIKARLIERARG